MTDLNLLVLDPAGLHARPAAQFVRTASRFASRITIHVGDRSADAKSLIALLGLTIRPRAEITLSADGPDADDALTALLSELGAAVEHLPHADVEPQGSTGAATQGPS
ncbi:MAG TPA: HPr family phosphocarrier protein [Candidatus Limnocylindrales bacterium]|nr:HPr family phosphocarrier protein [Candidatus Limnocylindrales bacterium]